jgi:hypothetical protein
MVFVAFRNSMGALLFVEAAPNFVNLSRVSPLQLGCKVSAGSSTTHRLYVGDRIAVCVSAMACTESHVVAPMRIGVKSERQRKWISGVFHDQEWERWEAIVCLVFHEKIMYSQISDKAISFQTMLSPDVRNASNGQLSVRSSGIGCFDSVRLFLAPTDRSSGSLPTHMLSARSPAKSSPKGKGSTPAAPRSSAPIKTLLAYNDSSEHIFIRSGWGSFFVFQHIYTLS